MVGNLKTFGKSKAKRDLNLVPILGDSGAVSRRARRKGAKNVFIAPFLPARLTVPVSPRMPRPQRLLIGKREDPGDDPDLTLTANFKMAAKEDT